MDLESVEKVIQFSLENNKPCVMWGETGCGKTETVERIAEQEGYNLVILHLSTQTTEDLIGMPDPDRERGKTRWLEPEWLVSDEQPPKTLYFLDEFNRYHSESVKNAMLPFLQSGKIHQHSIRPQDRVIAAANPPGGENGVDEYDVKDIWGEALLNRMGHVVFSPTEDEWFQHVGSSVDPVTLSILHDQPEPIKLNFSSLPFTVKPSRRSLKEIGRIINQKSEKWIEKNSFPIMRAYLGPEWAAIWKQARKDMPKTLQVTDILDRWEDSKVQTVVKQLFSDGRTDTINDVNEKIEDYLETADELTENQMQNFFQYLDEIPMDMLIKVIMSSAVQDYHKRFGEQDEKNIVISRFYEYLYKNNRDKWNDFTKTLKSSD